MLTIDFTKSYFHNENFAFLYGMNAIIQFIKKLKNNFIRLQIKIQNRA